MPLRGIPGNGGEKAVVLRRSGLPGALAETQESSTQDRAVGNQRDIAAEIAEDHDVRLTGRPPTFWLLEEEAPLLVSVDWWIP